MGFSTVAASAILMLAGFFSAGVYLEDWKASQQFIQDAEREAAGLWDDRVHTQVALDNTNYSPGSDRFTVTLLNDGSTVLRASDLDWVIDGAWKNDIIFSTTVDGDPTGDVWLPDTLLVVVFDPIPSAPSRLAVTTGNGARLVEAI